MNNIEKSFHEGMSLMVLTVRNYLFSQLNTPARRSPPTTSPWRPISRLANIFAQLTNLCITHYTSSAPSARTFFALRSLSRSHLTLPTLLCPGCGIVSLRPDARGVYLRYWPGRQWCGLLSVCGHTHGHSGSVDPLPSSAGSHLLR